MSVATISPRRMGELCASGTTPQLIDVRTPAEFQEVHAANARNIPLDRLDPDGLLGSGAISKNDALYLICRSGSRASKASERLAAAGFPNVFCVEGGTLAWVECGLPVVEGKKSISLERQVRIASGLLVLLGVGLGWWVHPAFLGLAAFVGAGQVFAGATDTCGMGLLLSKMPWNRAAVGGGSCCATSAHPSTTGNAR
jgi:rhodanese-related sulfurtransferase